MWLMGNHYINLVAYKTYDFLKKKLEIIKKIMGKMMCLRRERRIIKKEVKNNKKIIINRVFDTIQN